ncbi:hypothetical protein O1L60_33770 [Streptomyces diastatochromogenes]|nr:hypothetical protein [Streptomyces diastatochromogenes]
MARPLTPGGTAGIGRYPRVGRYPLVGRDRELGRLLDTIRTPPAVALVEGRRAPASHAWSPRRPPYCAPRAARSSPASATRCANPPRTGRWPTPWTRPDPGSATPRSLRRPPRWPACCPPRPTGRRGERRAGLHRAGPPELLAAVRALLRELGPAVLVVEDLQWADDASRELLLLLARDLPEQLSLVLTHRTEDLPAGRLPLGAAHRRPPGAAGTTVHLRP